MVDVAALENYCNELLDAGSFEDYCPNGLQVDAAESPIKRIVSAVTASQAAIDAALEAQAELLLVHHGYFWKGEPAPLTGIKGRRVGTLFRNGISLMAYHLPLDAHPRLGNNVLLGESLGIQDSAPADEQGLLWSGALPTEETAQEFGARIQQALGRESLHLPGGGEAIHRVGWCSGAAQGHIEQAAALGLDAFVSGEVSEQTLHLARELGVHYFAAGHHATERFGVQALGEHLASEFGLEYQFVDIPNPV